MPATAGRGGAMTAEYEGDQAIARALLEDWDGIRARLSERDARDFDILSADLARTQDANRAQMIFRRLVGLLRRSLPPGDPALAPRRLHQAAVAEIDPALQESLEILFAAEQQRASEILHSPDSDAWYDDLPEEVSRALLAAPALDPEEMRRRAHEPDEPHLIRLRRADGTVQLPAFQFDEYGTPLVLVLAINELLGADEDPWGVADWWLGPHGWLPAAPAECLGVEPDERLLAAARVIGEGV